MGDGDGLGQDSGAGWPWGRDRPGDIGDGDEQGQDNGNGFLWGQGCADILGMLGTACPWGWGHAGDSGEGVSVGLGTSWGQREWR